MGRPPQPLTRPYLVTGKAGKTLWSNLAAKLATDLVLAALLRAGLVTRPAARRMRSVIAAALIEFMVGLEPAIETAFRRWFLSERQAKGRTAKSNRPTDLQEAILRFDPARPASIVAKRVGCTAAYVRMVRKEKRNAL